MEKVEKPRKPWKASLLPNGIWEVLEYTYYFEDTHFKYRTVVRGITRDQAKVLETEHNKAIEHD